MKMKAMLVTAAAVAATTVFATPYSIHDGVSENSVGIGNSTNNLVSMLWGTNFTIKAGAEVITGVEAAFSTPADTGAANLNGMSFIAFVMRANPDGTPMQGGLVATANGVIASAGTDTMISVDTPDFVFNVGDRFMVGIIHDKPVGTAPMFPAAIDQTVPVAARSYAAFTVDAGTIDPNNINGVPAGNRNYIEAFGLPGNWLINATSAPVPEPATFVVLGAGLVGLIAARRRK